MKTRDNEHTDKDGVQNFSPFLTLSERLPPRRPPSLSQLSASHLDDRPTDRNLPLPALSLSRTQQNGPIAAHRPRASHLDDRPTYRHHPSPSSLCLSLGPSRPTAHEHCGSPSRFDEKLRQSRRRAPPISG
jgi:hypothetical protein